MIIVNQIGDSIAVSCRDKEYDVLYTKKKFTALMKIADASESVETMDELNKLLEKVNDICKNDYKEKVEAFHPEIYVQPISGKYYLKLESVVSSIALPCALVRRLEESIDKKINIDPVIKAWKRFLKNPKMMNGTMSSRDAFASRFVDYIEMIYVDPRKVNEAMDKGASLEQAETVAKTYEVKITKEGLLACFKMSSELEEKFVADDDGSPKKVNRFKKKFNADTGEIEGDDRSDIAAEDRVFYPYIQGLNGGDAFYCEGKNGYDKPGHFIKIGCTHRLADWSMVNCDDNAGCVEGLHLGGLSYIGNWEEGHSGNVDIHTCFVDPMHIGAIPRYSGSNAIRVLQYYVYGSLTAINHGMYHPSVYGAQTDAEWATISEEIVEKYGELVESDEANIKEITEL